MYGLPKWDEIHGSDGGGLADVVILCNCLLKLIGFSLLLLSDFVWVSVVTYIPLIAILGSFICHSTI